MVLPRRVKSGAAVNQLVPEVFLRFFVRKFSQVVPQNGEFQLKFASGGVRGVIPHSEYGVYKKIIFKSQGVADSVSIFFNNLFVIVPAVLVRLLKNYCKTTPLCCTRISPRGNI